MKKFNPVWVIVFFLTSTCLHAQVIKSEKTFIQLHEVKKEIIDKEPPDIQIIAPVDMKGEKYISSVSEINLIGKAIDESGISSVIINSEPRDVTDAGIFTSKLVLEPGENELIIVAMDRKDNFTETKINIEYSPPVLTLAEKVAKEGKYYGLIIGIDKYIDPEIQDLDNPIKDARKLYDLLISKYSFEERNMQFLKNANRADIVVALDELAQKVTSNDNLLIFYAGHGWWDENANNGYWLPSDARKGNKTDWFRNSTLVDYLKEINTMHTLLITDACFGGAIFKTRDAFSDAPKAIEKLYELPSRKAMTSGTLTVVPDRSAFTQFLVERLTQNSEKYLSSEQLFSSFRIAVINNSDVVPQYGEIRNVGDQGGDFIFIRK
jgi:hypothetical protein